MMRRFLLALVLALLAQGALASGPDVPGVATGPAESRAAMPASDKFSHGIFDDVPLYRPAGDVGGVVLLLSGEQGWDAEGERLARALTGRGALVAGIDTPAIYRSQAADDDCVFPLGDLDNLARNIQAYLQLPGYREPILAGYGAGAALAYAMHAQAQPGTFAGALTLDFCPRLALPKPLCEGAGTHFKPQPKHGVFSLLPATSPAAPWLALQHEQACEGQAVHDFVSRVGGATLVPLRHALDATGSDDDVLGVWLQSYLSLQASEPAPGQPPAEVSDLPVIEVPSTAPGAGDTFAILVSGDGGWAGFDKKLAAALAGAGVPVVGVDALRYFWTERTPAGTAADIERLIRFYQASWNKRQVILIGFSQGADVLPFVLNRLSPGTLASIAQAVLLSPGKYASFEFHVSNWLTTNSKGKPLAPEVATLAPGLALCVYGEDDDESICPTLQGGRLRVLQQPGGHHFDDDPQRLAALLLQAASVQTGTLKTGAALPDARQR